MQVHTAQDKLSDEINEQMNKWIQYTIPTYIRPTPLPSVRHADIVLAYIQNNNLYYRDNYYHLMLKINL